MEKIRFLSPKNILSGWKMLENVPGGKLLFSRLLARKVPYTGSITPFVKELAPGRAIVTMNDKKKHRNHLNCIHAIALANLAEVASGLSILSAIDKNMRGILTGLSINYIKKARGTLKATGTCQIPIDQVNKEYEVEATIRDSKGVVVATATALWSIGEV